MASQEVQDTVLYGRSRMGVHEWGEVLRELLGPGLVPQAWGDLHPDRRHVQRDFEPRGLPAYLDTSFVTLRGRGTPVSPLTTQHCTWPQPCNQRGPDSVGEQRRWCEGTHFVLSGCANTGTWCLC